MKRFICAVLCLCILLTGIIGITAAFADVPVIITTSTIGVNTQANGLTVRANVPGAPAKSGYYSFAIIKLTIKFKHGYGQPNVGQEYTKTNTKSQNGGWGQGTGNVLVSVKRISDRDPVMSAKADRTFQYYGIR